MRKLVRGCPAPRLRRGDPYEMTLKSVVGQQLSAFAADAIWGRMIDAVGTDPGKIGRCRSATLRRAGLSQAKTRTVKLVAKAGLEGTFDGMDRESDERVAAVLTAIKGVGPWTAEMVLMFALGRRDVWPVGDGGIQRAAARLYGVSGPRDLGSLGERFRPVRSYAAWYLWRFLET